MAVRIISAWYFVVQGEGVGNRLGDGMRSSLPRGVAAGSRITRLLQCDAPHRPSTRAAQAQLCRNQFHADRFGMRSDCAARDDLSGERSAGDD